MMDLITMLNSMAGATLSSIEFVWDYVQLRFDGPVLSIFSTPYLRANGSMYYWDDFGNKDVLCTAIGKNLMNASRTDLELVLTFSDNIELHIPTTNESESFEFRHLNQIWVG